MNKKISLEITQAHALKTSKALMYKALIEHQFHHPA
jgi:hypothetical protein